VLSLLFATSLLPGFRFDHGVPHWWVSALALPVEMALLMIVLRPLLVMATLPLNVVTLGLPTLFINGGLLYLAVRLGRGLVMDRLPDTLVGLSVLTVINSALVGWLGIDETYPFFQSMLHRLGRRFGPPRSPSVRRGLLLLQIDGLSHASLRRALLRGRVPAISALLARGSHTLHRWHCGIPSNTPAVQAGLLFGSRRHTPGYRWYDRADGRLRAASDSADLRRLEALAAADGAPLLAGGSCITSFLSGGATKRLFTLSAQGDPDEARRRAELTDLSLFWLSPFEYTKALLAAVLDFGAAFGWTLIGRLGRRRARVHRGLKQAAMRAVANSLLRETSHFLIKQDLMRGVPVIYSNFVGYDEVAHYGGADSYEALVSLSAFDRKLRRLLRLLRTGAPIAYDVVLLSDHGQSASVPFSRLDGRTLEELVAGLVGSAAVVAADGAATPTFVAALLAEMAASQAEERRPVAVRSRRTLDRLRRWSYDGQDRSGPPSPGPQVCVSGCLAHIYLTGWDRPAVLPEIEAEHPGLLEGLVQHDGIAFVAARRGGSGGVVIGPCGARNLVTGELHGDCDPLAVYGDPDRWAGEIARILASPLSGDLLVNGALLPNGQICVFEEQISSHGGLGGRQTEPFLVAPTEWGLRASDFDSPEALHDCLLRQMPALKGAAARNAR
jgi:uncharacterized membrane protein YvlD (DUF360 family)